MVNGENKTIARRSIMNAFRRILVIVMGVLVSVALITCQKRPENIAISGDGVSIAYKTYGAGNPALVFVHGWCSDKSYWDAQVSYFSQKCGVVTLDLGGHGESGMNRADWTIEAFGNDVLAVVQKLQLSSAVLIGHSMGGSVIVEAARHNPQSIIGLIGVDTFQDIERQPTQEDINTLMEPMREDFETSTMNFVCQILFTPDADTTLMAKVAEDMASSPKEIALSALENAWNYDMRAAFADVRVPIRGINSDFYPVNIDAGKRHTSSFEITFMSGVGHFLMMEDPVTFNQHLEDIIEALMQRPAGG